MRKKIFSNRNIIIALSVVFTLWLLFLDRNNLVSLKKVNSQINELKKEKELYLNKIKADSTIIKGLNDSDFVESYARENFYFKRAEEVMYIYK